MRAVVLVLGCLREKNNSPYQTFKIPFKTYVYQTILFELDIWDILNEEIILVFMYYIAAYIL